MTPLPFNGPLFAADFRRALDEVERWKHVRPHFNEKLWFRCPQEADQHDNFRRLDHHYQLTDSANYQSHVRYCEHLTGDAIARMNGKPLRLSASEPEIRSLSAIRAAEA